MLSPNDEELIRRDGALPELTTMLDPDRFLDLLRGVARDRVITAMEPTYFRYKPGTSCLAGFHAVVDGIGMDLHAITSVSPDKIRIRSGDRTAGGPWEQQGFALAGHPIVVRVFPNDAHLKVLHRLDTEAQRRRLLPAGLAAGSYSTLRYKPERRWVARIETADGACSLKVHSSRQIAAVIRGATTCRSEGTVAIGELVHADPTHGLVVQRWLEGDLMSDALGQPGWSPSKATRVGAALATIHQQGVGAQAPASSPADSGFGEIARTLGFLQPSRLGMLRTHGATLAGAVAELAEPSTTIHGDFYAKQVLLGGSRVGIIDFDEARSGDPAEDLGNFRAHLFRDVLRGRITRAVADTTWAALLAGYGTPDETWALRVQLFTAIGLLRLAPHPFRHREPDWADQTSALIDLSASALAPVLDLRLAPR